MSAGLSGGRPKPHAFVQVDLDNAYARLSVSPLESTASIKSVINQKLKELRAQLRRRSEQKFSAVEDEITEIQKIEARIASPKARERYDQEFPQNALLTVQPAPHDRYADPVFRAGVVTAWLLEELGPRCILPTPESLRLWASDKELDQLRPDDRSSEVAGQNSVPESPGVAPADPSRTLDISMLESTDDPARNPEDPEQTEDEAEHQEPEGL